LRSIPHFQNAERNFLDSHARGFSVTEKIYKYVDRGEWKGAVIYEDLLDKPQRWFTFDLERRLRFRTSRNMLPGELVDPEKFVVVTFGTNSSPWGEPVLDLCYWAWYLKHHAMRNQALWFERWASPTVGAKYKSGTAGQLSAENRRKMLEVMMAFQNDNAVAYPDNVDIKLIESTRNGVVSFDAYYAQLTEMESRIVTGQVLASMAVTPGSYAQAKVHAKEQSNKVEMLAAFEASQVSRQLGRDLINRNFGPQDAYPRFERLAKSALERQAEAGVEQMLLANGYSISRSWGNQKFQIVPPIDKDDLLIASVTVKAGQVLPVNPQLAEHGEELTES
jgi:phage gp29-like protein